MQIGLLENGMDSLKLGFLAFLEFEKKTNDRKPNKEDYFLLKEAILYTHHGVEILLKHALRQINELFIVSKIDDSYLDSYKKQRNPKNKGVYDFCNLSEVHTITFEEALHRFERLCDLKMQTNLSENLKQLNKLRNALTHAEIKIEDSGLLRLFQSLFNDLDVLFYKAIGPNYKTLTGYSNLVNNYEEYMKYLSMNGMHLKMKTTETFRNAIEEIGLSLGEEEVARITDISKAKKFIKIINNSNLQLGMDMFDYCCSGDTIINIIDDTHFSLWTKDNNCDFRFKFKSLILYIPKITKNTSPVIIFESDNDDVESKFQRYLYNDEFSGKYLEGMCFVDNVDKKETFDGEELNDFYMRCDYDESFSIPRHFAIRRYLDRKIFACLNVQGLGYWNFKMFLRDVKDKSGHEVEVGLRAAN